jgi:hypothetical protein
MTHEEVVADLPLLLTGELDRGRLQEVVGHLRGCPDCGSELVETATAHAALTAARRTLGPSSVGSESVAAEVDSDESLTALPPLSPLPPLSRPASRQPAPRVVLAAVAAAVVVALALGGIAVTGHWPGGNAARPTAAARQAALAPVPSATGTATAPGASGVVRMTGPGDRTDMTIRTTGLPEPVTGHFYYAWLLDPTTNKMLPLGVVDADAPASFEVSSNLVGRYSAVDISLQADDGDPAHSPVSVLRATYA